MSTAQSTVRDTSALLAESPGKQELDHVESSKSALQPSLAASERREIIDKAEQVWTRLCTKSQKTYLDRVGTGSGSDLVSDHHVIFPNDS